MINLITPAGRIEGSPSPVPSEGDGSYSQFEEELAKINPGAFRSEGGDNSLGNFSAEAQAREKAAREREVVSIERTAKAHRELLGVFDRIRSISDGGIDNLLDKMSLDNVTPEVIKNVASQQLLTPEQLKEFEIPSDQGVAMVETALTDYTIEMLGLDGTGMDNAQKIAMARRIWGRHIVLANIMTSNSEKGVRLNRGGLERHYMEEIYRELEIYSRGEAVSNLRSRVEFISAAMTTPEGAKKFIEMAIEREREKFGSTQTGQGAGEVLAPLS